MRDRLRAVSPLLAAIAPYVTIICALVLIGWTIYHATNDAAPDESGVQAGDPAGGLRPGGSSGAGVGDIVLPSDQPVATAPSAQAQAQASARGAAGNRGAAAPPAPGTGGSGPAAAGAGPVDGSLWPPSGMGSEKARSNPNCDPKTGKIKVPTVFAPPCVIGWPAGSKNGGETAQGVTADKIRVAVLLSSSSNDDADEASKREITNTLNIFQNHYEMWGRKLELNWVKASGTDEVAQRADAIETFNRHKPFAAFHAGQNPAPTWAAELAARGVLTVALTERWEATQTQPGLRWAANMDDRLTWAIGAEYIAKRLQGRPAQWSGSAPDRVRERVIGVLHPDWWDQAFMRKQAEAAGAKIAVMLGYPEGDTVAIQNAGATLIARMQEAGVTTVVSATDIVATALLTREATSQTYTPEWVVTGWANQDTAVASKLFDQTQWSRAFGFGPVQPLVPDEHYDLTNLYRWEYGRDPESQGILGQTRLIAHALMTGIHVTGPNLTAANFRSARFAAPPAGGSSCDCKSTVMVGYGRHTTVPWDDYTGFDDVTEKWWDPNTAGTDEVGLTAPGVYWKINGGRRYFPGNVPKGEPNMFTKDGAVERFSEPPPGEELPQYENPRKQY